MYSLPKRRAWIHFQIVFLVSITFQNEKQPTVDRNFCPYPE